MPRRRKALRQVDRDKDRQRWSSRQRGREQHRVRDYSWDGNRFNERRQVHGHNSSRHRAVRPRSIATDRYLVGSGSAIVHYRSEVQVEDDDAGVRSGF
ncbi:hypothetical protein A2U01_0033616, partial [Trifolium medium]|nr:hypothetical protein [Trifolium medium]